MPYMPVEGELIRRRANGKMSGIQINFTAADILRTQIDIDLDVNGKIVVEALGSLRRYDRTAPGVAARDVLRSRAWRQRDAARTHDQPIFMMLIVRPARARIFMGIIRVGTAARGIGREQHCHRQRCRKSIGEELFKGAVSVTHDSIITTVRLTLP